MWSPFETIQSWTRAFSGGSASVRPDTAGHVHAAPNEANGEASNEDLLDALVWGPLGRTVGGLLDRAVLGLMIGADRFPGDADYRRVRDEILAAHRLYDASGHLESPSAFHPQPAAFEAFSIESAWTPFGRYQELSFTSDYAPHADDAVGQRWMSRPEVHTAQAWALRHDDPGRPWLVCLHGLGTGSPWVDFAGFRARRLHAELGLNLLFPVLPLHGSRSVAGMPRGSLLSFELVESLHGVTQAVWDTRRAIAWARDQGATQIGVYGLSFGAYAASLLAGLEDLDLAIAGIPLCDVPRLFSSHAPEEVRIRAESDGIFGPELDQLYSMVSPLSFEPRVPSERRFLFAGKEDHISTAWQARKLASGWERPTTLWFDGGHISFFWSGRVDRFVEQALATYRFT